MSSLTPTSALESPSPAVTPPLTGRILADRYRLVRPLHEGGMGSVWLAEHLSLASPLAIKLMAAEVAKTDERLQRFLREARAAAALRSPHVVQIFDHGVDDGTPFIAMELLRGESLAARLDRLGTLDAGQTELVIRHVSRAIGQAHDIGIVHRDLTPANIFITSNADEELIKLLDFGIAKATDTASGSFVKQTRTGSFLGTPAYVSPEQLEESRRCDHRTDIWAMGVIAFECLLGRMPFGGGGIGGLVLDICSRPLPVPSRYGPVPEGFDAWFFRACARDLDERFASARDAAAALRALVQAEPATRLHPAPIDALPEPVEGAVDARAAEAREPTRSEWLDEASPATLASSTLRSSPGLSLPSAASSAPLARARSWRTPPPGWILLLTVAFLVVAFAWRGLSRSRGNPERAVQALQPPSTAGLEVLGSGPWQLALDDRALGPLPQRVEDLDPGEHRLRITGGAQYRPLDARVTLTPGAVTRVGPIALEAARRIATVERGAGADGAEIRLRVGEDELDLPDLPTQIEVEPNQPHVLLARRPGYAPYEQALTFDADQSEKSFVVTLTPLPAPERGAEPRVSQRRDRTKGSRPRAARGAVTTRATLTLDSTPDAAVLLDGTPLGITPLRALPVSPGTHRIIFIHGEQRQAKVIQSVAGKHRAVAVSFAARKRPAAP